MTNKAGLAPTQTDWKRLRAMTDADNAHAVANDPDAAFVLTNDELRQYEPAPARNTLLSLPLGGFPPGYEWDEAKTQNNIRTHGIAFHDAARVFDTPTLDRVYA